MVIMEKINCDFSGNRRVEIFEDEVHCEENFGRNSVDN